MSRVLSARFPDGVAARLEVIAAERRVKTPTVLKEAVLNYIDDHERGLPDPAQPGRVVPEVNPVDAREEARGGSTRLTDLRERAEAHRRLAARRAAEQ